MKTISLICAAFLLLAVFKLPIGYYTFLRIAVTIGAIIVIVNESKNGIGFWIIAFGITAILFNPLIPIHLHDKSIWIPIDILVAILFIVKALITNNNTNLKN
jgi:hypothetical protein